MSRGRRRLITVIKLMSVLQSVLVLTALLNPETLIPLNFNDLNLIYRPDGGNSGWLLKVVFWAI